MLSVVSIPEQRAVYWSLLIYHFCHYEYLAAFYRMLFSGIPNSSSILCMVLHKIICTLRTWVNVQKLQCTTVSYILILRSKLQITVFPMVLCEDWIILLCRLSCNKYSIKQLSYLKDSVTALHMFILFWRCIVRSMQTVNKLVCNTKTDSTYCLSRVENFHISAERDDWIGEMYIT